MGEDIDGRADQYSLAATAYHLVGAEKSSPGRQPPQLPHFREIFWESLLGASDWR
jgi:hypothetical protein